MQLPRGLYLGYLKLQSSVEVVRIVAPARTPNVPPHTRVRDNPHVSALVLEKIIVLINF